MREGGIGANNVTKVGYFDDMGMDEEFLAAFEYKKHEWCSRKVWFWEDLFDHLPEYEKTIKEKNPPSSERLLFCEDDSSFHREGEVKKYRADLKPPFNLRYIHRIDGILYKPESRLLTREGE
jgi:hypothetical protein